MEKENNGRSTTMITNTMKWNVSGMSRWTYSIWDVGVTWSVLRKKWCLPTEWRDIQRVTETECVRSIEADIFHLRHWPIEVSPDRLFPQNYKGMETTCLNLHDDQLHALVWEGSLNNNIQNSKETVQAYNGNQTSTRKSTRIFPVLLGLLVIVEPMNWRCTYPEPNVFMVRASSLVDNEASKG